MKPCKRRYKTFLLLFLFTSATLGAGERYITSKKASLLAEPKFGAAIVLTLTRGTKVVLVESSADWLLVNAGDARGWISRLVSSETPPLEKETNLDKLDAHLMQNTRRRASDVAAAGATRGLTAADRGRASKGRAADFEAVGRMESHSIDEQELDRFARLIKGLP